MQDIHDIKGVIEIFPFWREYLAIILALIALICVGLVMLLCLVINKSKSKSIDPGLPTLSFYEQAMQSLKDAQKFMIPGLDKVLSTTCSDIIRRYLEKAFKLQASEKTTQEFLHDIQKQHTFDGKALDTLAGFLEMCDLAKFAKIDFTHNEQKVLFEKASMFLELAHGEEVKILEVAKKREGAQVV